MENRIHNELKQVEVNYNVTLLFACEVGSRAWQMATETSDWDVRFIYVYPIENYLSIDGIGTKTKMDVIELPIHDMLDMTGWELTKALRLFRKSNPTILEWLHSKIIYYEQENVMKEMRAMIPHVFSLRSCLFHYLSMAENNFKKIMKMRDATVKDYLNVYRPLFISRWIVKFREFPPMDFEQMVNTVVPDYTFRNAVNHLLQLKRIGKSIVPVNVNYVWMNQVKEEIINLKSIAVQFQVSGLDYTENLNRFFRDTLTNVWSLDF